MTEGMPDDPRIGTVVQDRYQILERLSSGAMGVVYRAERVKLGRIVAVKFLHSTFAQSPDSIKRFELEARTMSRLEHPHCVSVIDFGVADSPFIVMEFVTGTTLRALMDEGLVPPRRAITIARQMLAGLAHAHEKGIIHRDVKPANVMLMQATATGDHVRLLDFGLAKLRDADISSSSLVVGTPSYMAPEQASGKKVDARTDVYATGVVLFELLTGDKPFFADQAFEVIRMHIEAPAPKLAEKKPGAVFSPELESVVARALAKDPEARFQTPEEMSAALERVPEWTGAPVGPIVVKPTVETSVRRATDVPVALAAPIVVEEEEEARGHGWVWLTLLVLVGAGVATWFALGRPGWPGSSKEKPSVAAGSLDHEIDRLHQRRRAHPDDAMLSFQLATLYHEKGWYAESLAAIKESIEKDADYKSNRKLNQLAIEILGDPKHSERARVLILKNLGPAAKPFLEAAAKGGKTKAIRDQAKKVLEELGKR